MAGVEGVESTLEASEYPLDSVVVEVGELPTPAGWTDILRVSTGSSGMGSLGCECGVLGMALLLRTATEEKAIVVKVGRRRVIGAFPAVA